MRRTGAKLTGKKVESLSKKTTRVIALVIVAVMVLSFLASMIIPYL